MTELDRDSLRRYLGASPYARVGPDAVLPLLDALDEMQASRDKAVEVLRVVGRDDVMPPEMLGWGMRWREEYVRDFLDSLAPGGERDG